MFIVGVFWKPVCYMLPVLGLFCKSLHRGSMDWVGNMWLVLGSSSGTKSHILFYHLWEMFFLEAVGRIPSIWLSFSFWYSNFFKVAEIVCFMFFFPNKLVFFVLNVWERFSPASCLECFSSNMLNNSQASVIILQASRSFSDQLAAGIFPLILIREKGLRAFPVAIEGFTDFNK